MSLKSIAKTTHEIWVDEEYADEQFKGITWVPLKEAEKIEKALEISDHNAKVLLKVADNEIEKFKAKAIELETQCCTTKNCCVLVSHEILRRKRTDYWKEKEALKKKIAEANKILDKLCAQCLEEQCCEGTACHIMDLQELLNDKKQHTPTFVNKESGVKKQ